MAGLLLNQRHIGYKVGLVILVMGAGAFFTGFGSPAWNKFTVSSQTLGQPFVVHGESGLWKSCIKGLYGEKICIDNASTPGWMMSVKIIQCVALVLLIVSGFYVLYANFIRTQDPPYHKLLEIFTSVAGGIGISSAVTYALRFKNDVDNFNDLQFGSDIDYELHWGFGVSISGSILAIIGTIVIGCFNRPIRNAGQQACSPCAFQGGVVMSNTAPTQQPYTTPYATSYGMAAPGNHAYGAPTQPPAYYTPGSAPGTAPQAGYPAPVLETKH